MMVGDPLSRLILSFSFPCSSYLAEVNAKRLCLYLLGNEIDITSTLVLPGRPVRPRMDSLLAAINLISWLSLCGNQELRSGNDVEYCCNKRAALMSIEIVIEQRELADWFVMLCGSFMMSEQKMITAVGEMRRKVMHLLKLTKIQQDRKEVKQKAAQLQVLKRSLLEITSALHLLQSGGGGRESGGEETMSSYSLCVMSLMMNSRLFMEEITKLFCDKYLICYTGNQTKKKKKMKTKKKSEERNDTKMPRFTANENGYSEKEQNGTYNNNNNILL